ncbi:MAG: hypothetical protein CL691_01825 [Cellvibrionales bacterium]|nr:hypothetical protein [Cellvibrionales bacterium]|tara:strand:- start:2731 stop:3630 length:900 start_codon:yes stop_codon:yes gene_type:complete
MLACRKKHQHAFLCISTCYLALMISQLSLADSLSVYKNKTIAEKSDIPPHEIQSINRVSIDGFSSIDENNRAIKGNGSGDIILVLLDETAKGPRQRSIMIDLNFGKVDSGENDFSVNDALELNETLYYEHPELTRFINRSNQPSQLKWSIFGIADHTTSTDGDMLSLEIINSGIVISHREWPSQALSYSAIHNNQALLSNLVKSNIEYGLESNSTFISFSKESSYYNQEIYGFMDNGIPSSGFIDNKLFLVMHQKTFEYIDDKDSFKTFNSKHTRLGTAEILFDDQSKQWSLTITPIEK